MLGRAVAWGNSWIKSSPLPSRAPRPGRFTSEPQSRPCKGWVTTDAGSEAWRGQDDTAHDGPQRSGEISGWGQPFLCSLVSHMFSTVGLAAFSTTVTSPD